MKGEMLKKIGNNFIAGLVVLLPLIVTLWIISFLFSRIVAFSLLFLPPRLEVYLTEIWGARTLWAIFVFLIFILVIAAIGFAVKNVLGRKLISSGEKLLKGIPVVKPIYETMQKISYAFMGQKLGEFQRVVLFEFPRKGCYSMGFITSEIEKEIVGEGTQPHVNIFMPTTPNPTTGFLVILPKKDVIPLDISAQEAMKFIMSVGAIPPESIKIQNLKKSE